MSLVIQRPERSQAVQKHGEGWYGLFDFDLWAYDIGFAADAGDKPLPLAWALKVVDQRMHDICQTLDLQEYEGFLTGSANFRYDIAKTTPYKAGRKTGKPTYWKQIREYLMKAHNATLVEGIEADDALAIRQTELGSNSIIISRDKDLRQVPGWHYAYPVGNQPEFGPWKYDELGELDLKIRYKEEDGVRKVSSTKLSGGGLRFFYSQVLTGDPTDTYPGCPGVGNARAYKLLCDAESDKQMYDICLLEYEKKYPEDAAERLREQAQLAWMVREYDVQDMKPVMWREPE